MAAAESISAPGGFPNLLSWYLDENPAIKLMVYTAAAISGAVIFHNWLNPSAPLQEVDSTAEGPKKRRRDPACALAILPDGSKDMSDGKWKERLPPNRYAALRMGDTDPANLSTDLGGLDEVRCLSRRCAPARATS